MRPSQLRRLVRRFVRPAVAALDPLMPSPWDIDPLVERLAKERRRPIHLIPWDFASYDDSADHPSGLWIPTRTADYIFFDQDALPIRREAIIGHELGHMLLGHTPQLADAPDRLLEALAPSINTDLARRILSRTRTGYGDEEEILAEEFSTSLIRRGSNRSTDPPDNELGRLTGSLQ